MSFTDSDRDPWALNETEKKRSWRVIEYGLRREPWGHLMRDIENRLRFSGHTLRRPGDRLVQRVLKSLSGSSWKRPPGRKRKFWTEVVKEDLRTLGVDRQFRRDVKFRRIWNSDE
ncbi:hypothetical protein RB195_004923 [Necator americanus]|uniref:Uncharacterized protein n=1 Tax=Necator americanus TaxID=51031 RepID=A0ABR1BMB5_NECAM